MGVLKHFYTASGAAICGLLLAACATSGLPTHGVAHTSNEGSSPEQIVDAQLAAYNRRDVEGFLSFYSDDAKLFDYPNQLTESGKDQLRVRYERSFNDKNVRALIVRRIVFDRFVIDHERITGRPDGTVEAIAVYEVRAGKIMAVTFYKP